MAQTWRSQYYPESWTPPTTQNFYTDAFLQDYSYAGYQHGERGISIPSTKTFDVTKAPYNADKTGSVDATKAIQQAINDAQNNLGGTVYLPAGTYTIQPGTNDFCLEISKSNIYLKGDGIGKTFILNSSYKMHKKNIILVSGSASWTTGTTTKTLLTADILNPVNELPVENPWLFKKGDLIMVRNYINDEWITEHKETDWLGMGSALHGVMYVRYVTKINEIKKVISKDDILFLHRIILSIFGVILFIIKCEDIYSISDDYINFVILILIVIILFFPHITNIKIVKSGLSIKTR